MVYEVKGSFGSKSKTKVFSLMDLEKNTANRWAGYGFRGTLELIPSETGKSYYVKANGKLGTTKYIETKQGYVVSSKAIARAQWIKSQNKRN